MCYNTITMRGEAAKNFLPQKELGVLDKSEKSAYRNNWIAEKLDRVNLTMPKGKKEQVKEVADRIGISLNSYINLAIDERMEKDKNNPAE